MIWHNECEPSLCGGIRICHGQSLWPEERSSDGENPELRAAQDIGAAAIEMEAFGHDGKPDIFGMIGGPPCPDFSSAGRHKGKRGA